jgi:hypothetical protein
MPDVPDGRVDEVGDACHDPPFCRKAPSPFVDVVRGALVMLLPRSSSALRLGGGELLLAGRGLDGLACSPVISESRSEI